MRIWGVRDRWHASYTIEASLVFPIIFLVLVFLLFLTFYAHDVVILKAICYETVLKAVHGGEIEDTGTIRCIRPSEEELFEYAQKRISGGVIDGKERRIFINLKEKRKLVGVEEREYSEAICEELDTPDFIRSVHRIQTAAKMVKEELTQMGEGHDK